MLSKGIQCYLWGRKMPYTVLKVKNLIDVATCKSLYWNKWKYNTQNYMFIMVTKLTYVYMFVHPYKRERILVIILSDIYVTLVQPCDLLISQYLKFCLMLSIVL